MAGDNFGLKIGVEGEKEFKKALYDINQSFKVLGSEMNKVSANFDKQDKSIQAITSRNAVLNKEIDQQKEKIAMLAKALENASTSFGENDNRTKKWTTELNNAQAELTKMEKELDRNNKALEENAEGFDEAGDGADTFGDEVQEAGEKSDKAGGKLEKLGNIAKGIGKALAAAVAAMGAAVGVAAKKLNDTINVYASFEDSMLQVAATMGMTAEEIAAGSESYKLLENAAKEAGANTRYSASEAAEALNYLALAGYDAEKAAATLPAVLNLAAAGNMSLAETSDLVTDAMSALGMETDQIDVFMDQMAKTAQKSNTSVQQLGEGILVTAGTAKSTGQELHTLNTSLGVLADNGIKGSEGGTKLRNVLLSLATPTDKAKAQFDKMGVAIYDNDGKMRQLNDIMADMNGELSKMSQEERTNALNDIFNKTDLNAVNALLSATTGRFDELSGSIVDSKDAAQNMAETMESGLAGAERSWKSAVEGMQIEIGSLFATMKKGFMEDGIQIIRDFTKNLQAAEGDWSKIGEAVGTLLQDVINKAAEVLPQIVEIGMQIVSMLGEAIVSNLPMIVEVASGIVMTLLEGVIAALPALTEGALQLIIALAEGIIANLPAITEAAIEVIATLVGGIGDALPELIPAIVEGVILIATTLVSNMDKILEAAGKIIVGLAKGLIDSLPKLVEALPKIIMSIIDFITKNLPKIVEIGVKIVVELAVGLIKAIPQMVAQLPQIVSAILQGIGKAVLSIGEIGKNIVKGLWDGIASMVTWITDKIKGFVGGIVSGVKGLLGIKSPSTVFEGIGGNMGSALGGGFVKAMDKVSRDMKGAVPTDFDFDPVFNPRGGTSGMNGAGGFGGGPLVVVQQMIVRTEDDIRRVSQELYNLMQTGSRAQGRLSPA
ncbi:phage tail tape measure protein [Eubacteriales bacterium OttesenSCG-928-A19]|nr:phage tail tape measure protein [Eubacteriales bacterium OttesenSCG-928-A19]